MARIPDETQLGERIVARRRAPIVEDRSGEIAALGAAQTAASIGNTARQVAASQDEFNLGRARSSLLQADAQARQQLSTDPDWKSHESRYTEAMTKAREEAGKMVGGPRAKAMFDLGAKNDIQRGTEQVREGARKVEGEWARSELDTTLEANRRAALETKDEPTRVALLNSTAASIRGARDQMYITPEQAVGVEQAWKSSYGEGFVNVQQPAEQLRLLKSPKGTPADFIDPSKRADLIERLEDKQRVAVDRREARAERAMAQYARQIDSGIPTTPEMMKDLQATIAGTTVAPELKGMLAAEKEVQDTLRKPVDEQLRLVQDKQAALKKGGTLADASNVQRLTNAVKQNITQLRTAPLLFAEQRLDTPNVPIDISTITDPKARADTAAAFGERAATLRTLSKRFKTPVPVTPLLPQEAERLSGMLDKASDKEAVALFAGLRDATGDMDIFKGAMRQIAPDSPVKASAGLLAAQQRELTTATHWFSPDTTVTSGNVAATVLAGDALLNPSKSDKADDGKPKTKQLYLPAAAQQRLQDTFNRFVGNVYAGRPEAANTAYQTVQAYYVGRASQLGQMAGDSQTVDTTLVREAVRATQGNVVDYNGNGRVLAPWGMAADDFEDRVTRAFTAEAKRRGLKGDISPQTSTFGLTNANGDGLYGVTLGKDHNLLLDKNSDAVTIDLKPADPRDAAGTIQR